MSGEQTAATAARNGKDSLFRDLFRSKANLCRLYREQHPEAAGITPDDIVPVTLRPVLMNSLRNDLAFLVREKVAVRKRSRRGRRTVEENRIRERYKLIVLVEAQSTWTLNILIRFLLYLATEYQAFVSRHSLDLFGTKLVEMPEPECYVVYCGPEKQVKDVISLREDVFKNPEANLDLVARVVHVPDPDKILGEYIIFCRVRDEQVRLHGATVRAMEETIRICMDRNVLRKYLEEREREEIFSMMEAMFTEEYRQRVAEKNLRDARREALTKGMAKGMARGRARGERSGAIRMFIEMSREYGRTYEETAGQLGSRFHMNEKTAGVYMEKYWKGQ